MRPLVSVLLPVHNGAAYLEGALQSILCQTYGNFELIIIDDGSSDESATILRTFTDPRIRVYYQTNRGLAATLNQCVLLARGEYLARQDQDDVSLPQRLEKQVGFLESHPKCGMVGAWAEIWTENTRTGRSHQHPVENSILKFDLLFDNPFVHSSVMLKKSVFNKVGFYSTDKSRQPPEDYELWSRVARYCEVANIPETLLVYREIPSSMSRAGVSPFLDKVINISIENLLWVTGRNAPDQNISDLAALAHGAYYRVSRKPRLGELSRILFEAADKLSESCNLPSGVLRNRAGSRLKDIRHHYWNYRHLGGLASGSRNLVRTLKRLVFDQK